MKNCKNFTLIELLVVIAIITTTARENHAL